MGGAVYRNDWLSDWLIRNAATTQDEDGTANEPDAHDQEEHKCYAHGEPVDVTGILNAQGRLAAIEQHHQRCHDHGDTKRAVQQRQRDGQRSLEYGHVSPHNGCPSVAANAAR